MAKEKLRNYVGDFRQLAGARKIVLDDGKERGVRAVEIWNGSGLNFTVLTDRGMDIGPASYEGMGIALISPVGFANPATHQPEGLGWLRTWGAGLMTSCGLQNVGNPDEYEGWKHGLHGVLSHTPAEQVSVSEEWINGKYHISVTGTMKDNVVFGHALALTRKISTVMGDNTITIEDKVENQGTRKTHCMLLYHINIGYPVISPKSYIRAAKHMLEPRDKDAEDGIKEWNKCSDSSSSAKAQCFYHDIPAGKDGFSEIAMVNPDLKLEVAVQYRKKELPFFTQWKLMGCGEYVTGFEPANSHVEGVNDEISRKTLKYLKPGESFSTVVKIKVNELK